MTVPDCIDEYLKIEYEVFGQPRHRRGLRAKHRYSAKKFGGLMRDLAIRRDELLSRSNRRHCFASGKGLCST